MHGWIQLAQEFKYALRSLSRAKGLSLDRKSTRLNSSHLVISYAVFCLKKYMVIEVHGTAAGLVCHSVHTIVYTGRVTAVPTTLITFTVIPIVDNDPSLRPAPTPVVLTC